MFFAGTIMIFICIYTGVMAHQMLEFPLSNDEARLRQHFEVVDQPGIELPAKNLIIILLNREDGVRQPVQRARDVAAVHQLCADLAEHKTVAPKVVFAIAP